MLPPWGTALLPSRNTNGPLVASRSAYGVEQEIAPYRGRRPYQVSVTARRVGSVWSGALARVSRRRRAELVTNLTAYECA